VPIRFKRTLEPLERIYIRKTNSIRYLQETMETKPEIAREIVLSLQDRFRPEKLEEGFETIFHFDIEGKNGGQFTAVIEKGSCRVSQGLEGEAKCTIKTSDVVYEEIELGKRSAEMAFMMGKIKVSDLNEMLKFTKLFKRLF
tara:strand:+ start:78662 stop:79087 length:426 start_codon:yes stop_codon:yes gene_type:complete